MDTPPHTGLGDVVFRHATIDQIIGLRQAVIIAGTDRDTPDFEGDRREATRHFGAFVGDACVGCLSLICKPFEGEASYQLRGMAVDAGWQGRGLGAALLRHTEQAMAEEFGELGCLWCNARAHAAGFYAKHGWRQVGDGFDVPGVGPHVKMVRRLR